MAIAVAIYFSLGLMLGVVTVAMHRSLHNVPAKLVNIFCHKCSKSPGIITYSTTFFKSFFKGKCSVCGVSWNADFYIFSLVSAIQFAIIALQASSGYNMALLCLLVVCLNFLILNGMEKSSRWEDKVCLVILTIAMLHALANTHPVIQLILTPIIILAITLTVKIGAKLFIGADGLKPLEMKVMIISSTMLQPNMLASYLFLVGVFAFIWALGWKIAKKKQEVSLMPAIVVSLMACLLLPKLVMVINHMLL